MHNACTFEQIYSTIATEFEILKFHQSFRTIPIFTKIPQETPEGHFEDIQTEKKSNSHLTVYIFELH